MRVPQAGGGALIFIDTVVSGGSNERGPGVFAGPPTVTGGPAQQAVEAVLLKEAGVPLVSSGNPRPGIVSGPALGTAAYAAAERFVALSPAPATPGLPRT